MQKINESSIFVNKQARLLFWLPSQQLKRTSLSQVSAKRPLTTLQKSTKKKVTVRLKNEVEYKGKMDNVDSYMNLIMTDAEELHDGKTIANYGRVIVRGNNVLFIKLENDLQVI